MGPRREEVRGKPQVLLYPWEGYADTGPTSHPLVGTMDIGCVLCPVFLPLWWSKGLWSFGSLMLAPHES